MSIADTQQVNSYTQDAERPESPKNSLCGQMALLRRERGETPGQFGAVLAAVIHPNKEPFSRQYVNGMESGRMAITPEIARALGVLAAMLDGVSELQARAVTVPMLAVHPEDAGAVVLPKAKLCGLPGCQVRFVGHSTQKYCSPECRKEYHRRATGRGPLARRRIDAIRRLTDG